MRGVDPDFGVRDELANNANNLEYPAESLLFNLENRTAAVARVSGTIENDGSKGVIEACDDSLTKERPRAPAEPSVAVLRLAQVQALSCQQLERRWQ
jgi:hypothetical protein